MGEVENAIISFTKVVELQDKLLSPNEKLDQVTTLKLLAEELIKNN